MYGTRLRTKGCRRQTGCLDRALHGTTGAADSLRNARDVAMVPPELSHELLPGDRHSIVTRPEVVFADPPMGRAARGSESLRDGGYVACVRLEACLKGIATRTFCSRGRPRRGGLGRHRRVLGDADGVPEQVRGVRGDLLARREVADVSPTSPRHSHLWLGGSSRHRLAVAHESVDDQLDELTTFLLDELSYISSELLH